MGKHGIDLTEKVVDDLEQEMDVLPNFDGAPRLPGDRRKARSDEARQAWRADRAPP